MFIIYRENITHDRIPLDKEEIQHIRALRLKPRSPILVSNGNGIAYKGILYDFHSVQITHQTIQTNEKLNLAIFSAIPSGNRFEKMMDMAVQLGISYYQPIIFERSQRKQFSHIRIIKIIKQAASQSGRFILPIIQEPILFEDHIHKIQPFTHIFYADTLAKSSIRLQEWIQIFSSISPEKIMVLIGPEGGFSPTEREYLKKHYQAIQLNTNILRIETAVISILSIAGFINCQKIDL